MRRYGATPYRGAGKGVAPELCVRDGERRKILVSLERKQRLPQRGPAHDRGTV